MKSFFTKILICCSLSLITLEVALELQIWWLRKKQESQTQPFFLWTVQTSDLNPISWRKGQLALQLDPELGYRNLPLHNNQSISIASLGNRGTEPESQTPLLLITGGSFAFGTGLTNINDTFAKKLSENLQGEVINAAVIGYASGQEDLLQRRWLKKYQPKLCLSIGGRNDFFYYYTGQTAEQAVFGEGLPQLEKQLKELYQLSAPNPFSRGLALVKYGVFPALTRGVESLFSKPLYQSNLLPLVEEYTYRVGLMAERSKLKGLKFLLVLQPDSYLYKLAEGKEINSAKDLEFAKNLQDFYRLVRARLATENILNIDLNEYSTLLKLNYFMDTHHLNAAGHAIVAELLSKEIKKLNLIS